MRIRKKEPSVGILGKIVNSFTNSKQDTYSADYINTALKEYYSTEETFTGKYWIDGKKIYRKVINAGSQTWNSDTKTIPLNLGSLETLTDYGLKLFYPDTGQWYVNWDSLGNITINAENIQIASKGSVIFSKVIIIVEYTKTTE